MKRAILAAALAAALITTAHAYPSVRTGSWTTYKNDSTAGVPTCGSYVSGRDRNFYIKYQPTHEGAIHFQLFKNTWRFGEGNEVPLVIGIDKNEMIKATGKTYRQNNISFVEFFLEGELAGQFLREFGEANKMWIRFDAGNEDLWVADMTGSRAAAKLLMECIASLPKATQPFGDKPAEPAAAKKKDNGGI